MLAPQPFYSDRGTPMNVLQMCRALTNEGWRVDVLTFPMGRDVEMPGLRIERSLPIPGIRDVPIGFSFKKLLLDIGLFASLSWRLLTRRYDVVHAIEEGVFLAVPFTWFGIPLIYDLDSLISDQLEYSGVIRSPRILSAVRALERLALRRSTLAITVCRSLTTAVEGLEPGTRVHQIEDVPLAETEREPDPELVARLRSDFDLGERRVVVYTGNLEKYQGIDLLLEAAADVFASDGARLVLVGGEPEAVDSLRSEIAARGLSECTIAVGARPPSEMSEWMALADVLVSPRSEGGNTPLKIYSYMRSGTPIVATRSETHTQVLSDETAYLCDTTPAGLAAALREALAAGDAALEKGERARSLAADRFAFEEFRKKLLSAYADLPIRDG